MERHRPLPNWLELPPELTMIILRHLDAKEILTMQWVCMAWHNLCMEPSMWRSIDMYNFIDMQPRVTRRICTDIVNRSCGGLESITLRNHYSSKLLLYIADRAPLLRSLRLSFCIKLHSTYLAEAAKKLPNLQELHIFSTTVSIEVIKTFGHCCTQLKSLTYDNVDYKGNEVALAISQTMPGLRHLRLGRSEMTNNGLHAILIGCPYLETLDLRLCFYVNIKGAFATTCADLIKNLKLPNDPIDNSKYDRIMKDRCWYDSSDDEISTN